MAAPTVSKIMTAWKLRRTLLPVLFPGGRLPTRLVDLEIRWQVVRLLARSNRYRMYQPMPFAEFADVRPSRSRACDERWQAIRSALPADLSSLRFLDLGAAEGYFAFQCAKEGAGVLALDQEPRKVKLMNLLKERYKLQGFNASQVDLATVSLRPLGKFDYAFYLNVHQHIYKADPHAANRILSELSDICTRGLFMEARPIQFRPEFATANPSNPQPFKRVEDLVDTVKWGTGLTEVTELLYEGHDAEPDNRQSVPEDSANRYRLFFLTRPVASQIEASPPNPTP